MRTRTRYVLTEHHDEFGDVLAHMVGTNTVDMLAALRPDLLTYDPAQFERLAVLLATQPNPVRYGSRVYTLTTTS